MTMKDHKNLKAVANKFSLSEDTLKKGLPSGWTRTTMVIREEFLEKLKDFAYWERTNLKDLFDEIVERFLSSRKIEPRPKAKKKIFE